ALVPVERGRDVVLVAIAVEVHHDRAGLDRSLGRDLDGPHARPVHAADHVQPGRERADDDVRLPRLAVDDADPRRRVDTFALARLVRPELLSGRGIEGVHLAVVRDRRDQLQLPVAVQVHEPARGIQAGAADTAARVEGPDLRAVPAAYHPNLRVAEIRAE